MSPAFQSFGVGMYAIWRHHAIYCTQSAYSVAYISVENYLIWLKFGQVTKFLVLFHKNKISI